MAVIAIIIGLFLALNVRGSTERFFHRIDAGVGWKGHKSHRTLRIVGIGGVVIGFLMLLPDLI
ncbi:MULTISPECIES: hypothetical protein [unclassified Streptomyces]|uniref:hypothetical protein n=1 Tax=unclassified Streptomyces TaxID=2593676 RepID=UPI001319CDB2|nr:MULTISPECIES: hypothetical protein [unclassified Streptomyces]MYX36714.1 hypothetical protein [Streptomyces sp. SID8377]